MKLFKLSTLTDTGTVSCVENTEIFTVKQAPSMDQTVHTFNAFNLYWRWMKFKETKKENKNYGNVKIY